MTMPLDLVLIRHGESEGNLAYSWSRQGDNRAFTPEYRSRPSSEWRLTTLGRQQTGIAGEWIRVNIGGDFARIFVSSYVRAEETAYHLGLTGPMHSEPYLRERDYGILELATQEELAGIFAKEMARRTRDPFYWNPSHGESMPQVCLRVDRVIDTMHRELSKDRVAVVCHGEVMRAFQVRLERWTDVDFGRITQSRDPKLRINNTQIIHYTRKNPADPTDVREHLAWVRSVCPWDLERSDNQWREVSRRKLTREAIAARLATTPQLVDRPGASGPGAEIG